MKFDAKSTGCIHERLEPGALAKVLVKITGI